MNITTIRTLIFAILLVITINQCTHPIFCFRPILEAVAKSNIFKDSKTFVDLTLKVPIEEAQNNFMRKNITEFIELSFHNDPDIILQAVSFKDFQTDPPILQTITNLNLKQYAKELNRRWNLLGKKVVLSNAQKIGSCLQNCTTYLPQLDGLTLLVPGGRFRQSYYWDTYWIILGLIASDMLDTAESLIDTFGTVLSKYGFIPNGMRQYYLNRSQPPFYFLMIQKLSQALMKKGLEQRALNLQKKCFDLLLSQNKYWNDRHSVYIVIDGKSNVVNQYRAKTITARPESYRQDINTVSAIVGTDQKQRVYGCLSSMAESGWDFSSRWLTNSSLTSTVIDDIVPTDLNALLAMQQTYLIALSSKLGRSDLINYFTQRVNERKNYFKQIKKNGRFPDLRITNQSQISQHIYPTDYFPYILFNQKISNPNIYQDLVNPKSSDINTGQQWDSPNVWAPNNWIIHEALTSADAYEIGKQWVHTTYCSWKKTGNLYQKYRNDVLGQRGQGGQYEVQTGFGWTNGLALHYLSLYGKTLQSPIC